MKCGHCDTPISSLCGRSVTMRYDTGGQEQVEVYSCPSCDAVFSAHLDMAFLRDAIIERVVEQVVGAIRNPELPFGEAEQVNSE